MVTKLKYLLGILIAIATLIPMLQSKFQFFDEQPLEGLSVENKPEFKKENYWDLTYQDSYNKYLNDNFGFRPWLVRLYNQVQFSFYNSSKAPGVVVGKEGELFIESYIDDYIGKNYIGGSKVNQQVSQLKTLQDSLKARGKDLVVVFAPGKASYYPELIPDRYMNRKKDSTNYKAYSSAFIKSRVNFIDLNKWFFENKTKFKHKVYPKYGTHWNHYGMCFGLDTIVKYIEKKRNLDLPEFDYSIVNYNTALKGNDYDIGVLMNLLHPLDPDPNPYPVYKYKSVNKSKPDVLVVGDSYWWCQVGDDMPIHFFREDEYWFYNKTQIIRNEKRQDVKKMNLSASLAQRDVVLLIATEATFYMFPYGFVENAYSLYCKDNNKRLNDLIYGIKMNKNWAEGVIEKAANNNISVEAQLRMDAEYMLSDELLNPKETLDQIIAKIKSDPNWMKEIKKKAQQNNLSIEKQVHDDAQWLYDQDNK
ncbi:MAG: hypothetical protein ABIP51_14075 [Bacteroidia bacterium]